MDDSVVYYANGYAADAASVADLLGLEATAIEAMPSDPGVPIDGANLIQYLYSSYPDTRDRAVRSACRVLGYRTVQGYYQQHPEVAGQDESVLLVALTEELLQNGLLVDEES